MFSAADFEIVCDPQSVIRILKDTFHGIDSMECVIRNLCLSDDNLLVAGKEIDLREFSRIRLIGAGKAVIPMAAGVISILGNKIDSGCIITKQLIESSLIKNHRVSVLKGNHPIPDEQSIRATKTLLSFISDVNGSDLVIFLLSGGASALLVDLPDDIPLTDYQTLNSLLIRSPASIDEINVVRKHFDLIKGGGLARKLFPATVVTLIIQM